MSAYYNENDPYAAQWLRNLITRGHICPGDVDERSIEDVLPSDLTGYTQCHFFAGIGVWSHALRRAGWRDDRSIWTGSCPCQPFSEAGKGDGFADERHLWPAWLHLIKECDPSVVVGEQVEAAIRHAWLDLVQTDMEGLGYAFGPLGLPAAGFGAPHIRGRIFFAATKGVAYAGSQRRQQIAGGPPCNEGAHGRQPNRDHVFTGHGEVCLQRVGDPLSEGLEGHARNVHNGYGPRRECTEADRSAPAPGCTNGLWRDADWLPFRDGKIRPVEPGTFPLAAGTPSTVGRLRAYGNAICSGVAEEFVSAFMECQP